MGNRLRDKIAVVTGASRGIGLAISDLFAREGATVAMLARGAKELARAAEAIDGAHPFSCNVGEPAQVAAVMAEIEQRFGGIDILINNAAIATPRLIEETVDSELAAQVAVNLLGPAYCMRHAIAAMRRRGGGDIINISSESVNTPYPFVVFYAATKSALENLTAGTRAELMGSNIRVSLYRSGRVESSFDTNWDADALARVRARAGSFNALSGGRITADIPARTMLDMITLDRSAHIDVIQLRGT